MKKIILFTVVFVVGIYLFATESDNNSTEQPSVAAPDILADENTSAAQLPHKGISQVNTAQSKPVLSQSKLPKQTEVKQRENSHIQDEVAAVTKLVDATLDDNGIFDMEVLSDTIDVDNFALVLERLDEDSNELETAKRYEIESLLTKDDELAVYETGVACGQGMCAVNLAGIPNEQLSIVKKRISKLNLGSTFQKVKAINDYESNVRIITPSIKNDVTTIRTKDFGSDS